MLQPASQLPAALALEMAGYLQAKTQILRLLLLSRFSRVRLCATP